ncbi:MAG: hypothetical protein HYY16_01285 [Planctomycetes bacterium]|nr:hypothetical protein [Planctomycetota bacterium]
MASLWMWDILFNVMEAAQWRGAAPETGRAARNDEEILFNVIEAARSGHVIPPDLAAEFEKAFPRPMLSKGSTRFVIRRRA